MTQTLVSPLLTQNPHIEMLGPVDDDHSSEWTDDERDLPLLEPIAGTRRARVDDDGDDARDRRHPSERQPPRPPAGLFGALFGFSPPGATGGNPPGGAGGDAPPELHTGEGTADPSSAENNPTPGHTRRGVPILTAGFTLTIPLFGPPPGNQTGAAPGGQAGQGVPPGMPMPGLAGMDAATREELLASFAAFFQEFQALEDGREDPERAKKLVAGLEVIPLGLVKRLERVGGAPGGHVGDSSTEGSSSGCAICWDTLLDAENDGFRAQQPSGGDALQSSSSSTDAVDGHTVTHTDGGAMDVDTSSPSASRSEPSTSVPPSPELPKIISLPCAHVFHASCLLPWFTRARQATCPTCRFNIDPENLTYTPPPRRAFTRAPAQPGNAAQNTAPGVPPEAPSTGTRAGDAAVPPADATHTTAGPRPETVQVPFGPPPPPPTGQGGVPPIGLGFNPFGMPFGQAGVPPTGTGAGFNLFAQPTGQAGVPPAGAGFNPFAPPAGQAGAPPSGPGFAPFAPIPGLPILSFPAIQIPIRPPTGQAPGDGVDVLTIGLDMFLGGALPEDRGEPRDNADGANGAANGGPDVGAAGGNGAANPNGFAQDIHALIDGFIRTTRNIIPQMMNAQGQGQGPAPAEGAPPAEGARPQPQPGQVPQAGGPQPVPPPTGARFVPMPPLRPNMFRPTRPMPPRRERKTWILPPAPGPSLREHVEQREREQGLRCSDMSCGVGPSDDEPTSDSSVSMTKQISIHPLACPRPRLPAERVAGWGGEDKTEPLVEVSCPIPTIGPRYL
ncbi:hypothetical protein JVU11DRAFT_3656 [Chiua virens]|nr:hypothetical protein JVU11DRAFT_3656 [Chiua virens]